MLTAEIIAQNEALKGLSEEQINSVIQLSQNDTQETINKQFSEVYRRLDETTKNISGIDRNGDEKTYNYIERALTSLKENTSKLPEYESQISDLQKEKSRLEKLIQEGATDEETKKQIRTLNAELADVKGKYSALQSDYQKVEGEYNNKMFMYRIDGELNNALAGVKIKADQPEPTVKALLSVAMNKLKSEYKPEYRKDASGKEVLVFLDSEGVVKNNPANGLNPFTAKELLINELKPFGIIDEGGKGGAGTKQPGGNYVPGQYSTRDEARAQIEEELFKSGLKRSSLKFNEEFQKIWKDREIDKLPLQ